MAVIVLVEGFVYQPLWNVRAGREHADRIIAAKVLYVDEAPAADCLFLGDSSVSCGVDAAYLTQHFAEQSPPRTFLNLGLVGSASVGGSLFMLERYLSTHPPPRVVVLMFSPLGLNYTAEDIGKVGRIQRSFHRPDEIYAYRGLGSDVVAQAVLSEAVPSSILNDFFFNFPRPSMPGAREAAFQWEENGKFYPAMVSRRGFTPVTDRDAFHERSFYLEESAINRAFLKQLVAELRQRGVKVYFDFPPVPDGPYQVMRSQKGTMKSHQRFFAELREMGVERLGSPQSMPDQDFGSLYHLKEARTRDFNIALGDALVKALTPK